MTAARAGTLVAHLGIELTAVGDDWLEGTLPVDARTQQPYGILHGGASVVLAETLGGYAANLCVDPSRFRCVGQEISASHLRPVESGLVTGRATPVHLGRRSQVWQIAIRNAAGQPTCLSRLTMAVLEGA
ncbi:MAG: hotdog fold thioesterase [Pseudomonadota bacterium]